MNYLMFSLQKQGNKCCENVGHVFVEKIIILRIIFKIFVYSYNPVKWLRQNP